MTLTGLKGLYQDMGAKLELLMTLSMILAANGSTSFLPYVKLLAHIYLASSIEVVPNEFDLLKTHSVFGEPFNSEAQRTVEQDWGENPPPSELWKLLQGKDVRVDPGVAYELLLLNIHKHKEDIIGYLKRVLQFEDERVIVSNHDSLEKSHFPKLLVLGQFFDNKESVWIVGLDDLNIALYLMSQHLGSSLNWILLLLLEDRVVKSFIVEKIVL